MNYRKIYFRIVFNAKSQNRKKHDGIYYESHHILPKSLFPLWEKRKSNLVLLTAKEHYFCHELLTKIFPSREMNYALWFLSNSKYHHVSLRQYERAKHLNYLNSLGENNPNYGNRWSDEQRLRLAEKLRERNKKSGNPNFGKYWSKQQKDKMREKIIGRHFYTNGEIDVCVYEDQVPDGFIRGHCKSFNPKTDEGKKRKRESAVRTLSKFSSNNKGLKCFHNSEGKNIMAETCPDGFMPGRYMDEEKLRNMKLKNSISNKNRKHSTFLKIKNIETNEIYNGLKEAAIANNISVSMVSAILKNRRKSKIKLILV